VHAWYFVLHFFSGQRREGDFQFYADQFVAESNMPIVVLSIDIVNDTKYGDLSNQDTLLYWLSTITPGKPEPHQEVHHVKRGQQSGTLSLRTPKALGLSVIKSCFGANSNSNRLNASLVISAARF
jgi:hypothetical protein